MEKSKLIETAKETVEYYQEKFEKKPTLFYENEVKSAKLSNSIIKAACEIENLTPSIIRNALKTTEEIVERAMDHDTIL